MYGKQAKIGKFDESCQEFLFGSSKVAKNLRFEARQLLDKLLRFSKILRLRGSKMELLI